MRQHCEVENAPLCLVEYRDLRRRSPREEFFVVVVKTLFREKMGNSLKDKQFFFVGKNRGHIYPPGGRTEKHEPTTHTPTPRCTKSASSGTKGFM